MPKTRVILTVDTEPSIAGAMEDPVRFPPLLEEPVWGEVNGRSEALGFITRTLEHHDLRATFFVETVHTRHFGPQAMNRFTDHLQAAGQDIQLHIHPVWKNFGNPPPAGPRYNDDSSALGEEELTALINEGCDQIKAWTGTRPVAMRTGNFSANRTVYRAMKQAQLYLASNICIASADYEDQSLCQAGGVQVVEGVHELTVGCFIDPGPVGKGRYRAAQITACSASELTSLLDECHAQSAETLVLVTHPFEFIKKADFRYTFLRPNRLVQQRLEVLCQFLRQHQDRFEVCTFGALGQEMPLQPQTAPFLKSSVLRSLTRATQNFVNDRI
jgi:hypothetical protein